MVIGCCEKCKNIDLIDENQENICPKCGERFVSLGVGVDEWNELDNDGMLALVEKALAPKKPVIKQLQQPTAPSPKQTNHAESIPVMNSAAQQNQAPQNSAYSTKNGYPQQNPNVQQQKATRPAPPPVKRQAPKRQPCNTTTGRILFDTPLLPIICIGLCIWDWFSDPPALTYILSLFIIGLAIFTIVKKCRIWGLSIAAIVIAALCIIITVIGSALGLTEEKDKKSTDASNESIAVSPIEEIKPSPEVKEEPKLPPQTIKMANLTYEFPGEFKLGDSQTDDKSDMKYYLDDTEDRLIMFGEFNVDGSLRDYKSDDEIVTILKGMGDQMDSQMFYGESMIDPRTNTVNRSGESGNILYNLYTFEGFYKLQKVAVNMISFLNGDRVGIVLYLSNLTKYPNDKTFNEVLESAGIYIDGSKTITSNRDDSSDTSGSTASGVDPDMKAFLDSYESFMNDYVDFMKKYTQDPGNAITMLSDYYDMLKRYEDFAEKADKYDQKNMSKEDLDYYLDTMNRINKKYLEVLQ